MKINNIINLVQAFLYIDATLPEKAGLSEYYTDHGVGMHNFLILLFLAYRFSLALSILRFRHFWFPFLLMHY